MLMGSVFKKTVTRPLPPGAEFVTRKGVRCARWKDARGKDREAPLTASGRVRVETDSYYVRYRDGQGILVDVPTKCRDRSAALQILAGLERQAEKVRSGLLTPGEAKTAAHSATPITEHLADYVASQESRGFAPQHVRETRRILTIVFESCDFRTLADLERSAFERHLNRRRAAGAGARTRNADREALLAFANWCVADGRLLANPVKGVPKAAADRRRPHRAMTVDELVRLLDVARRRPLLDASTVRRGERKGEAYANVRPEVRERLDALGRERALIYKTLFYTGLRKGELTSLTVAQLRSDGQTSWFELDPADEKNREGNSVVVRPDLADDLRHWLADKLRALQADARERGAPVPARLPGDTPVFRVPFNLVRVLDLDLKAAGIPKRDERGRTLDVHALRTTFCTHLSLGGVPLRTAQAAMRHSDPKLTANVYTDPKLLDVAGAMDVLPYLPLDNGRERARATGTGTEPGVGGQSPPVAPDVALPAAIGSATASSSGRKKTADGPSAGGDPQGKNRVFVAGKAALARPDIDCVVHDQNSDTSGQEPGTGAPGRAGGRALLQPADRARVPPHAGPAGAPSGTGAGGHRAAVRRPPEARFLTTEGTASWLGMPPFPSCPLLLPRGDRAGVRARSTLRSVHVDPGDLVPGPLDILDRRPDRGAEAIGLAVEVDRDDALTAPEPGVITAGLEKGVFHLVRQFVDPGQDH
jgi:integrase